MRATSRLSTILAAALFAVVAGQARAAEVEPAKAAEAKNPWRGSAITYEHSFSALSLDKSAEPDYNPYYAQSLMLRPEWHFGDNLYLRGGLSFEQELTDSDETNVKREVVVSDLTIDAGGPSWKEENSGVKVSGSLRLNLPVSKKSAAEQLYLGLAPGLSLSRKFDVADGLILGYQGRFTYNIRKSAQAKYDGSEIRCAPGDDCSQFSNSGRTTSNYSIGHGPSLTLEAMPKLSFMTSYTWVESRLYDLEDATVPPGIVQTGDVDLPSEENIRWRYLEWFVLEGSYQVADSVGVAVGLNTVHPQQQPNGEDYTRFFNRLTAFYVDVNVDVDAVAKLF
jgi:hypothetical protein